MRLFSLDIWLDEKLTETKKHKNIIKILKETEICSIIKICKLVLDWKNDISQTSNGLQYWFHAKHSND